MSNPFDSRLRTRRWRKSEFAIATTIAYAKAGKQVLYACLEEHRTELKAKFEAEGVNARITKGGIEVTKKEG